MSIIIFGGDRLGKIPHLLKEQGFQLVQHVTGRKKGDLRTEIHPEAEGVLVLFDYLSHNMVLEVKAAAKRKGIKTVFSKRSWSQISQALPAFRAAEAGE
jgi:hypothetical protein